MLIQEGYLVTHTGDRIVTHTGDAFLLHKLVVGDSLSTSVTISAALDLVVNFDAVLVVNVGATAAVEDDPIIDIGRITQFKSVRNFTSNNALLTWLQQGVNVDRVDIYRSIGQRGLLTKVGESTTSSYTDSGLTDTDTVSYQVVPINLRSGAKKGKASYIVYNAGSDKIL